MNTSEQINEIAGALAKAQAKIGHAAKDSQNPHFRKNYADLASIRDACQQALAEAGIAVIQAPGSTDDGCVSITTRLAHSSGQWLESSIACRPAKNDAQALGSVVTYLRRYSLAAMVGVAPAEDDGEGAVGRGSNGGDEMKPVGKGRNAKPPQRQDTPFDDLPADTVDYVQSNGGVKVMSKTEALAKLWSAHDSNIVTAAFQSLCLANDAWLKGTPDYAKLAERKEVGRDE